MRLARSAPEHGAIDTLDADYAYFGVGIAAAPDVSAASTAQLDRIAGALAPYDAGRYANVTEERLGANRFFDSETQDRLRTAKAAYDPDGVLRVNYAID